MNKLSKLTLITKNQIVKELVDQISNKVFALKTDIDSLVKDSSENSKPTSGDKHEVGLEMAMGELDRLSGQLNTYKRQLSELELMESREMSAVDRGALVRTSRGVFFISVAFGQLNVGKTTVFCLSPQSPLAQVLIGAEKGDLLQLNGMDHEVIEVI